MQHPEPTMMVIDQSQFDRVLAGIEGLPGYRRTRPTTTIATVPIVGAVTTYVVQSFRTADEGNLIFLQVLDREGQHRIILPNKVAAAIYRQQAALTDRSTPASRKRDAERRKREADRKAKAARKAKRQQAPPASDQGTRGLQELLRLG